MLSLARSRYHLSGSEKRKNEVASQFFVPSLVLRPHPHLFPGIAKLLLVVGVNIYVIEGKLRNEARLV